MTEIPIFFGFSGPKIGMGGFLPPELSPKPSKTLELGLFWSIFVCSGVVQQQGIDLGDTLMPLLCFQLRKKVDFLAIFYCARRSGI